MSTRAIWASRGLWPQARRLQSANQSKVRVKNKSRADFLTAITGNRISARAADQLAAERLAATS